jgi:hypothetical protein
MNTILRCASTLALGCALAGLTGGMARAQEPPNGDFEDGVLEPWIFNGAAGVSDENVLKGDFSGFISTGEDAVGEVCSTLESDLIFPPTDRARVKVGFKVRYKTDEDAKAKPFEFYEDPFHAELRTAKGAVDLLTIKVDGIFWTKGEATNTDVKNLRPPPQTPPFKKGDLFEFETRTLDVSSKIKLKGCEPVAIKFQICDWFDEIVDSAAFLDEVKVRFEEDGDLCEIDNNNGNNTVSIMDGIPANRRPE